MSASVQPASPATSGFVLDDLLSSLATEAAHTTAFGDTDEVEAPEPTTDVPDEEVPAEEAKEPEAAPEEPVLPEGTVLVPKIDRPLVTEFVVKDKDGDIEVPDLTITFTANGKERHEPLDQVVRLAQRGVYNVERDQQAEAAMQAVPAMRQELAAAQAEIARRDKAIEALFQSDEAYLDAREAYEKSNSPEAKLAKVEAERQAEREQRQFEEVAQRGRSFAAEKLDPALELMAKNLPMVTEDELAAQIVLATAPYMVQTPHGQILHPDAHAFISKMVVEQLLPWAQDLNQRRTAERTQITTTANSQVQKAQVESQKAKNLAAKGMKPTGRAAPSNPPRRAPRNADEAVDDVLRDTLAAMR